MNKDRFDDALRRKLEEVNPPFQEKNWTQLQRFMASRGFPPSIWHAPVHWLQPALTAAAAASLLVVSIWQYRTNQTLNDRIQTLTTTVSKLEQVQTTLQKTVTDIASQPRPDTVYVVQRVPVAMPSQLEPDGGAGTFAPEGSVSGTSLSRAAVPQRVLPNSVPNPVAEPNAADAPGTLPAERWSTRTGQPQGALPRATDERIVAAPASPPESAVTVPDAGVSPSNPERTNAFPADRAAADRTVVRKGNRRTSLAQRASPNSVGNQPSGTSNSSVPNLSTRSSSPLSNETPVYTNANPANRVTNSSGAGSSAAAPTQPTETSFLATVKSVDRIASLTQSGEFADNWQRRLRRVRYRSPYAPALADVATVAPEKRTNPTSLRWRLGVGGDATTAMTTYGIYGELVVNNQLTISAGFGQATWSGDSYQTEIQFSERTKRDFRREYPDEMSAGNMGPGNPFPMVRKFYDINRTASALLIPVQIGYRLPIGQKFFLTPFVGATIGLAPSETVSFAYERVPRDYEHRNTTYSRPVGLYSSWTLGAGLERQVGPFVAQLSPLISVPVMGQRSGLNASSVGLRARVYYQF
ncbi:hypothetical protein ACAW74_15845 [Fibrella sp. WM1]|uniref:hypothetical protein n=1 Tax=Fibrella musci TaxID=3242485 RepID=UPI00352210CC